MKIPLPPEKGSHTSNPFRANLTEPTRTKGSKQGFFRRPHCKSEVLNRAVRENYCNRSDRTTLRARPGTGATLLESSCGDKGKQARRKKSRGNKAGREGGVFLTNARYICSCLVSKYLPYSPCPSQLTAGEHSLPSVGSVRRPYPSQHHN